MCNYIYFWLHSQSILLSPSWTQRFISHILLLMVHLTSGSSYRHVFCWVKRETVVSSLTSCLPLLSRLFYISPRVSLSACKAHLQSLPDVQKVNADPDTHTLMQGAASIVYLLSLHPSNTDCRCPLQKQIQCTKFICHFGYFDSLLLWHNVLLTEYTQALDSCFSIGWWQKEKESCRYAF